MLRPPSNHQKGAKPMKIRPIKAKLLTALLTLCMMLSLTAFTAYAGELPKPDYLPEGVTYSNDYDHTYHTQVNVTANVSVKDSDGTVVETTQVSKSTEEFLKGGVLFPLAKKFDIISLISKAKRSGVYEIL
jgi:hypothetical protein